jgi:hypothetical protein
MAARMKRWNGKAITQAVAQNVAKALGEYGLRAKAMRNVNCDVDMVC